MTETTRPFVADMLPNAALAAARSFTARAVAVDLLALACVAVLLSLVSPTPSPTGEVPTEPLGWSLGFSAVVLVVAALRGDYRAPMRPEFTEVLRQAFGTMAVSAILLMTGRVVLANDPYVAAETLRHWAGALGVVIMLRCALLWLEARARRKGERLVPTLVVGAGYVGQRVAARLLNEPEIGLRPVAFLDRTHQPKAELPVHVFEEDLELIVRAYGIRHAILAFAYGGDSAMPDLARKLWELGIEVNVVPRLFELGGERTVLAFLGAMPVAVVRPVDHEGWRMRTKYALDRVVAASALILLAPLLAALGLAVLVTSGRPILFSQLRVGNDGRRFEMFKFRTMRPAPPGAEADADWASDVLGGPVAVAAKGRTTPIGRLLRRTSLDELPQLVNVLRGDMSLIGPRPERVAYAEAFQHSVRRYADRHRVKSGLTGWAQVSGLRGKTSLEDRVEWDNHYIEHWSPWLDLKIVLLTLPQLLRRSPA